MGTRFAVPGALCALLALGFVPALAQSWCDVVFKDVAREADAVVMVRVDRAVRGRPYLRVIEVLKGSCTRLVLAQPELEDLVALHVDHLLLAVDAEGRPVQESARGLGACAAVSVLPIRGGKLRARDRPSYDSLDGSMTLDELKAELRKMFGND